MVFFKLFLHLTSIQILEDIASFNHDIPVRYIKGHLLTYSAVMAWGSLFCLLIFFFFFSSINLNPIWPWKFFHVTKIPWEMQRARRQKYALAANVCRREPTIHQRDESKNKIVGTHNDASLWNLFLTPVQVDLYQWPQTLEFWTQEISLIVWPICLSSAVIEIVAGINLENHKWFLYFQVNYIQTKHLTNSYQIFVKYIVKNLL